MVWEVTRVLVCQQPLHYLDSYTLAERGGMPRTDRAVTTCRHPLNRGLGQCIYPAFTPKHHAYLQRTYSDSKEHDKPPSSHKAISRQLINMKQLD